MIRTLTGKVIEKIPPRIILEVGGVGYGVFAPIPFFDEINTNDEVSLFIYHHITENKQELYGFLDNATRDFFELLISVSGVGPKVALAILSSHNIKILKSAIAEERPEVFATASGVGKKTAERIIVDLKSKISMQPDVSGIFGETYEALRSLGYTANEAKKALAEVPEDVKDTSEQVRLALKNLAK